MASWHASGTFEMFNIETPPNYRLDNPPLVQAFGQIRYATRASLATTEGIAPVQAQLDEIFPYLEPKTVQQFSLQIGPAGPVNAGGTTSQTWLFTDDSGWSASISADAATLMVGPTYKDFGEFSDRFRRLLDALKRGSGVTRSNRIGIRYVNVAETPMRDPSAWQTWFSPQITGWIGSNLLDHDTQLTTSITQSQLSAKALDNFANLPSDVKAIIRHGLIPAKTEIPGIAFQPASNSAFLLDIDLIVEGTQNFDTEYLTEQLTGLHDEIDRFFYWCLTEDGKRQFGFKELD